MYGIEIIHFKILRSAWRRGILPGKYTIQIYTVGHATTSDGRSIGLRVKGQTGSVRSLVSF